MYQEPSVPPVEPPVVGFSQRAGEVKSENIFKNSTTMVGTSTLSDPVLLRCKESKHRNHPERPCVERSRL